jgi:hypothetical protein
MCFMKSRFHLGIFPPFWKLVGMWIGLLVGILCSLFLIVELTEMLYNIKSNLTILTQSLIAISFSISCILLIGFINPLKQFIVYRFLTKKHTLTDASSKLLSDVHTHQRFCTYSTKLKETCDGFILICLLLHLISSGGLFLIHSFSDAMYTHTHTHSISHLLIELTLKCSE